MVYDCVLEPHIHEHPFVHLLTRVDYSKNLVLITGLDKRCQSFRSNHQSCYLISLLVNKLAGFVGHGTETLPDEREEAAVDELLEEGVSFEGLLVDTHSHSDLKLCWEGLHEVYQTSCGHPIVITQ